MANDKSTFLRNAIYNAILRNIPFQGGATVYLSLHSAAPGLAGANEIAGNAYARVAIAFGAPVAGAGGSSATVTFPAPNPAVWAVATHFGIWDAAAAGNFFGGDALNNPITTSVGVPVTFPTGNVTWTET